MSSLAIKGGLELQQKSQDLLSTGKEGKKIFRKGLRAAMKVIAKAVKDSFPRKTGTAAMSTKVKSLKRKKGRIGLRVSLFARSEKGYPYPMGLEGGVKTQPKGGRVRKVMSRVTVNGVSQRRTDEVASKAYHALAWKIKPQHNVAKAFDKSSSQAEQAMQTTFAAELDKVKP